MRKPDAERQESPRRSRPRGQRIEVWLTADEKQAVADRASEGGLSLSAYMRAAGLNHPIRAKADTEAVAKLVRVAADIGRLGGLLKLWLSDRRDHGAPAIKVSQMLDDTRQLQQQLLKLAMQVRRP